MDRRERRLAVTLRSDRDDASKSDHQVMSTLQLVANGHLEVHSSLLSVMLRELA